MGGGKGGTTTSTVSIPPEVLARYNAVNARAEEVAKQPFQPYTGQFVAGLTPTQEAGIRGTSAAANLAQPFYGAGAQYTMQGAQAVGPLTQGQISYYQDPFTQSVVAPTQAALQQEQGQQRAALAARQASTGAFGGDRAGLERANLARQQGLGMAQAIAPLYSQGYQTGVQTAVGQQGVVASDLQRRMAAGQQIAGLGTGAQAAALQGAQQQLAAGTAEQQTKQADLTAQYQQFLQQQGYPFQVAQFLANIAMGTGALSGSTTTTQQPSGFFSDRRLKHDVHEIGKTHDGQPIYSFKYNGDNKTQIGLMAQDVEKKHPEAVGVTGGYKTVDYGKATEDSERPERALGGLASMGGSVWQPDAYAGGGLVDGDDIKAILQAQQAGFGPFGGGLYGGSAQGTPGAKTPGVVPQASLPVPKLVTASPAPARQASGLSQAASTGANIANLGRTGVDFKNWVQGIGKDKAPAAANESGKSVTTTTKADVPSAGAKPVSFESGKEGFYVPNQTITPPDATPDLEGFFAQGGVIPFRHHRGIGGVLPYKTAEGFDYVPSGVLEEGDQEADQAAGQFKKNAASGSGGSGGDGLGTALGVAKTAFDIGKFLFLKDGGVVPRHHYDDGGDVPVPQYKIVPQPLEEMPEHRQELIKGIYGPESGGRYDIRFGGAGSRGKTFDPEKGHPNIPEARDDGRTSTAAGAGQFLKSTWDDVTGGAPMTKPYMDAATWSLASRDYAKRTGRDLDADLKEQGFSPAIKSALSGTWEGLGPRMASAERGVVPARVGRESSLGDVFRSVTSEGIPSSENFWIPALSGIGSMLASTRPTFLGALGEGLVGGTSGYMALQKQQLERAKEVVDYFKQNYTLIGPDKFRGPDAQIYSAAQLQAARYNALKGMGVDPRVFGVQPPSAPSAPSAPGTVTTAQPKQVTAAPASAPGAAQPPASAPAAGEPKQPNLFDMNKEQLKVIAETQPNLIPGVADNPNFDVKQMRADYNDLLEQARNFREIDPDKHRVLLAQANDLGKMIDEKLNAAVDAQEKQNAKIKEASAATYADYKKDVDKRASNYDSHEAKIKRLADINADFQAGAMASFQNKLISYMKGTPLQRLLPEGWQNQPSQYGEAYKLALVEALQAMGEDKLVRAPKIGVETEMARVPSPDTDAGAVYALLGQTYGELLRQKKLDADFAKAPAGTNPGDFNRKWSEANENNKFYRDAYSRITAHPTVTPSAIKSLQQTYSSPTGEVFTPKVKESGGKPASAAEPAQAPAAPSVPEPLRNMEGLVFSPSRKQYRDSSGRIYDMNGKQVQ